MDSGCANPYTYGAGDAVECFGGTDDRGPACMGLILGAGGALLGPAGAADSAILKGVGAGGVLVGAAGLITDTVASYAGRHHGRRC